MIKQIKLILKKDPSIKSIFEVFLLSGFWAVIFYRLAHFLYIHHLIFIAKVISCFSKLLTGVEIHPGAVIGKDFFIDHGYGIVIGETSIIGDDVTIFHGVTLGARFFNNKKRHPTIGNHVLIGCHATVLGDIKIGDYCKVGANTVVLEDISSFSTVVGEKGKKL